ncbi:MAG: hypothetical protein V9E89_19075 [Ilumatobacteraceae bacterium]
MIKAYSGAETVWIRCAELLATVSINGGIGADVLDGGDGSGLGPLTRTPAQP